jgi:hypothetical protein
VYPLCCLLLVVVFFFFKTTIQRIWQHRRYTR